MEYRVKALETPKASEAKVSTVSLKLPPFWPNKTTLWFAHMEADKYFASAGARISSVSRTAYTNEGGNPFVNEGDC